MLPDRIASTFQTASQGLDLQRERIAVASRNIANAQTSAPVGSDKVYRPQTVVTRGPGQQKFIDVLGDSMSSVQRTNARHMDPFKGPLGSIGDNEVPAKGLGPQFTVQETESFRYEFDPDHPDADENGMVRYPDVDMVREMAELVSANRLYEANLSSIQAEKEIIKRSFEI
ncbi:flagellar basal body rod protein FlgC [Gracilimonas mengyeensis]|uniref:Flagellar basal-body rod protein FlgC n=1 Tax=Gracilimonas mengyeensis TaxID=1302730 RepID=A0A521EDD5_9BACT|nr:flagellar basal body rod C-terminal domain-containing protein [Gracilimonas mengyeensis]SMO81928.1 flagellar basal-body rod protein FlgC [Gracilimonas mengyeensis]